MNKPILIYTVILFWTVLPFLSILLSGLIAKMFGIKNVNEGSAPHCIFMGINVGKIVFQLFVGGWYSLITLPTGIMALFIYTLYLIIW